MKGLGLGILISIMIMSGGGVLAQNAMDATADTLGMEATPDIAVAAESTPESAAEANPVTSDQAATLTAPESEQLGFLKSMRDFWSQVRGYEFFYSKEDLFVSESSLKDIYKVIGAYADNSQSSKRMLKIVSVEGGDMGMAIAYRPDENENVVKIRQGPKASIQTYPIEDIRISNVVNVPLESIISVLVNYAESTGADIQIQEVSLQTGFAKWVEAQIRRIENPIIQLKEPAMGLQITTLIPFTVNIPDPQRIDLYVRPDADGEIMYPVRMELFGPKSVKKGGLTCSMERINDKLLFRHTWSHIKVLEQVGKENLEFE